MVESRILSWRTLPGTSKEPILCELDPSEEISERRMLVEKPIAVSCMGNVALKKLIQVFQPNFQFKIAICQRELKMGILEHVVPLIQGTKPSLMLMKETGWSLLEQMRCLPQIDECPTPSHYLIMNIILWNCRGALNPHFQRTVADLVNRHSPAVLIITETRIGGDRAKEITSRLPFDGVIIADTIGFAGGIWLLWNSDRVDVAQLACTEQEIHATVKVRSSNLSWLISSIYASPRVAERKFLWSNLVHTASLHHLPWLLLGDFNEVLCSDDKFGGLPVNFSRAFNFKYCLDTCGMIDLGFHGPRFTWSNLRELSDLIQERLDRCFANSSWRILFPEASVHHLTRTHSDHCPVLLCLDKSPSLMLPRPFRLQSMWMSHPSFSEVVDGAWLGTNPLQTKISVFTESAKVWNKEVFGNLVHKKARLEARLRGIQVSLALGPNSFLVNLEKQLRLEFLDILQLEEEFWAMKSRINWIVQGERNTNFFHTSVVVRRKRNRIVSLKDNLGNWVHCEADVAKLVRDGFLKLFTSEAISVSSSIWSFSRWPVGLSEVEKSHLASGVTLLEVKEALWSLKPFKAPGPDGLHAGFFQRYWGSVGDAVFKEVSHIFDSGCMPEFLNQTLLTLIPKCPGADCLRNFRPISLCNTLYKVVTKIIVKRLRVALPKLVSPLQTAFVPGRKGIDNMILVQELVHTMGTKKGKEGYMAIKIDLEKAYDRLEWHFIRDILLLFNFPASLIKLILSCVSSSSISVLFNGGKLEEFQPSRGIRQGDPLSPYLFILCMELLGFLIHEKCEANLWTPLKVARGGPAFSHLFFADDLVLFAKADRKNCCHIRDVLDTFCDLSGQKVNLMKSKVYFSPNVKVDARTDLCLVLGFNSTPNLGRYLGFPIHQPRSSSHEFDFLLDRVQGKLAGWKANMLSMAGRLILTQAVTTSIPSYVMQGALLPGKILQRLDKVNRDFLWGSTEEKKKLHLVSWKKITKPKRFGGLGLQSAKEKNLALLAKLCWRFKTNHVDGWANALRKKYLGPPRPRKCNFSKTWKALKKGEDICDQGSRWVIGSHSLLSFWYDPWIKQGNLRSLIVGPLHCEEEKLLVKDVVVNGDWHLQHLSFVFPPSVLSVLQATPLRKFSVSADKLC